MPQLADFLADLGVNIHMDATETGYGDVAMVAASLRYLGFGLVRDHAYDIDISAFQALTASGVRLDLIVDSASPGDELDAMQPVAGSIASFEGPNEPDINPVDGATDDNLVLPAVAEQAALYTLAKSTPDYAQIPILDLSIGDPANAGAFAAAAIFSEIGNVHAYAGSAPPWQALQDVTAAEAPIPGRDFVITETGYATQPGDPDSVDLLVQAKFTLDTLLDAAAMGARATFLYELLDEAYDPTGADPDAHFGLFNADGSPKPVATAIHNLTSTLSAAESAGPALAVSPSVSGLPESGHWLQLGNSGGPAVIAVWAEPALKDSDTGAAITADTVDVTIQLGVTAATVLVYDPLVGTAPIAQAVNAASITVAVTDHPLIIEAFGAAPVSDPAVGTPVATDPVTTPPPSGTPQASAPTSPAAPADPTPAAPATTSSGTPLVTDVASGAQPGASTPVTVVDPVYRFFDTRFGTHFYTDSAVEQAMVSAPGSTLVYEGVGLKAVDPASGDPNAVSVYRFFDSTYGTHFFTASAAERDSVQATRPDLVYEGVAFAEHTAPQPGDIPVYRFFDTAHGTHFYTASGSEQAAIVATRPDLISEGIGFYAPG